LVIFLSQKSLGVAKSQLWFTNDQQHRDKMAVASKAGSEAEWHRSGRTLLTLGTRTAFRTVRPHPEEGSPGCRAELTDNWESEFGGKRIRFPPFRCLGRVEQQSRVGWPISDEGSKVRRLRGPWNCILSRGRGWRSGAGPWPMELPKIRFGMEAQPKRLFYFLKYVIQRAPLNVITDQLILLVFQSFPKTVWITVKHS